MQCIHSPMSKDSKLAILTQLQQATYQPAYQVNQVFCPNFAYTQHPNHTQAKETTKQSKQFSLPFLSKKTWQQKKTWIQIASLQFAGLFVLCLPTKSLTSFQQVDGLERITASNILTVAMADTQIFIDDEHMHSFELDAAQRYAKHLGTKLDIRSFDNEKNAKLAVSRGVADIFIGTDTSDLASANLGCHALDLSDYGLDSAISFGINPKEKALFDNAKDYLCQEDTVASTKKMAKFYQANFLDAYSEKHFERAISERLPDYKQIFKAQADKYNHDWELLVAISYQESHLNPNAISRTGVQGLMMLTNDTAALMGIEDRTNPTQSIQGGAKYLKKLNKRFEDIPQSERLWFVLSAYNMGPNAVRSIQQELKNAGKDPNSWSQFYSYLNDNANKNSRYVQCMHYVTNIRHYLEILKGDTLVKKQTTPKPQYHLGTT